MADDGTDLSKQNQKQVRTAGPVPCVESSDDEQPNPPPKRIRFNMYCPEPVFPDSPSSSSDDEDDDGTASEGEEVGGDDQPRILITRGDITLLSSSSQTTAAPAETARPSGPESPSNTTTAGVSASIGSMPSGDCGASSNVTQQPSAANPGPSNTSPDPTPGTSSVGCQTPRVEVEGGPADLQQVQRYLPVRPDGTVSQECVVCLETDKQPLMPCCKKPTCNDCLILWMYSNHVSCPHCKVRLPNNYILSNTNAMDALMEDPEFQRRIRTVRAVVFLCNTLVWNACLAIFSPCFS